VILEGLINRGSVAVLEQVVGFTEARHHVLVDNISNFDTVGYKVKDLPQAEFVGALTKAIDGRENAGAAARLEMRPTRHLKWDQNGKLHVQPVEIRENNILFHDQNNRFVEKQMATMAKNAMLHNVAAELLKGQYNLLKMAITERLQ